MSGSSNGKSGTKIIDSSGSIWFANEFAKIAIKYLLPDGKLPKGKMLETHYTDQLRLVDQMGPTHHPGYDARYDEKVDIPRGINLRAFLKAVDEILGIKHCRYEGYTNGYLWSNRH